LTVKQDEKQIFFESRVDGNFGQPAVQEQTKPAPTSARNALTTAVSGGGNASPGVSPIGGGAADANSGGNKIVFAHGRALATVIRRLSCNLDGKDMVRETGGLTPGKIIRRASWKKGDKTLELYIERDIEAQGNQITTFVRVNRGSANP
jgi:hypothetical protein